MDQQKNAIVIGGTSGIGLATALEIAKESNRHVYIAGRKEPKLENIPKNLQKLFQEKLHFVEVNLSAKCSVKLEELSDDVDMLLISAGFGRVAAFEELSHAEIQGLIQVNELSVVQIIRDFYGRIKTESPFYCGVVTSIAGLLSSPMFSVYSAAKGGLCRLIESLNAELAACGYTNRILNIAPGYIEGTNFYGAGTDLAKLEPLAKDIIAHMYRQENLYIPKFEEAYHDVLLRYQKDPVQFGIESYEYKQKSKRQPGAAGFKVGYMSGTFDLFHIGHLNLIKRAKMMCDYLVVGVHKDGRRKGRETFISLEERMEIVRNLALVDEVILAPDEDSDAFPMVHYQYLFVGSDYKGTERFARYEKLFAGTDTQIVYFPYTAGTSSTQLREALNKL